MKGESLFWATPWKKLGSWVPPGWGTQHSYRPHIVGQNERIHKRQPPSVRKWTGQSSRADLGIAELRLLKQRAEENRKLKQVVEDLTRDKTMLQDLLPKAPEARQSERDGWTVTSQREGSANCRTMACNFWAAERLARMRAARTSGLPLWVGTPSGEVPVDAPSCVGMAPSHLVALFRSASRGCGVGLGVLTGLLESR